MGLGWVGLGGRVRLDVGVGGIFVGWGGEGGEGRGWEVADMRCSVG